MSIYFNSGTLTDRACDDYSERLSAVALMHRLALIGEEILLLLSSIFVSEKRRWKRLSTAYLSNANRTCKNISPIRAASFLAIDATLINRVDINRATYISAGPFEEFSQGLPQSR